MSKIRNLREAMGMGLVEACHEIKIHPYLLSAVERGKLKATQNTQDVVCGYYGIVAGDFFDKEGFAV